MIGNFDAIYALIMLAAIVTCGWLVRRNQRGLPLAGEARLAIGIGGFCGAMIGAKLPFALGYPGGTLSLGAWLSDGKTILTGLVGGYFGVELAKHLLGVRTKTGDSFAAPVALAVAVGRLCCFRAGCCFGTPTDLPWGVTFPLSHGQPCHPTQLYEAAFHLTCAGVLVALYRDGVWRGNLMKAYLIAYATYRFFSEFLRPEPPLWIGLTGYQLACVPIAAGFALLWWKDSSIPWRAVGVSRRSESPEDSGGSHRSDPPENSDG